MAKEKIYLDTSIPSAYFDDRIPYQRDVTRQFWKKELRKYDVYISEIVERELSRTGGPKRAKFLKLVTPLKSLSVNQEVEELANAYRKNKLIPEQYVLDALHIALVSCYKIDYLLTWNFEHLANIHKKKRIKTYNAKLGIFVPEIATPEEFLGG